MKRVLAMTALAALTTVGCKSSKKATQSESPKEAPADPPKAPDDAAVKKRLPIGHAAYSGTAITNVDGLVATNATLTALDGSELELETTWKSTYSLIVFYRGHW